MTPRENALLAYQHKVPEWVPNIFTDFEMIQANPAGERYIGTESGKDWFGIDWTFVPEVGAPMPTNHDGLFDDVTEWRQYVKFPDLDAIDWEKQADIDCRANILGGPSDDDPAHAKAVICMIINGPFERLHAFMGMTNALCALIEEPEACKEFFSAMADYKIAYIKKIAQYYKKVDIIEFHDDYGTANSLFMSMDTWRELIKPSLKRIVDACHELGLIYQHHSCGYIEPLVEDMVEIGVDAIDHFQRECNPNVKVLKQKFGDKITFCGGFDNANILDNPNATKEQIQAEYVNVLNDLAPGGSYVAFPITLTFNFVPHMVEQHFMYGLGFYRNQC